MRFYKHDTDAHKDEKIIALRVRFTGAAVDCYYAIIERLYECEKPLLLAKNQTETIGLILVLNIETERFLEYVEAMVEIGLLERDDATGAVHSERVDAELAECARKHEIAVQNGSKGGRPSGRKPNGNQRVSKAKANGKPKKPNKDNKTVLDSYTAIQYKSGRGAAAAGAAPHPVGCPTCGSQLEPTNAYEPGTKRRYWRCPECGSEEARDE